MDRSRLNVVWLWSGSRVASEPDAVIELILLCVVGGAGDLEGQAAE